MARELDPKGVEAAAEKILYSSPYSTAAEAYRAGRIAGLFEAAEMHDAEIVRLETQIAENIAYCERTGKDPNCSSNRSCWNSQDWHRRSAKNIRANAAKLANEGDKKP